MARAIYPLPLLPSFLPSFRLPRSLCLDYSTRSSSLSTLRLSIPSVPLLSAPSSLPEPSPPARPRSVTFARSLRCQPVQCQRALQSSERQTERSGRERSSGERGEAGEARVAPLPLPRFTRTPLASLPGLVLESHQIWRAHASISTLREARHHGAPVRALGSHGPSRVAVGSLVVEALKPLKRAKPCLPSTFPALRRPRPPPPPRSSALAHSLQQRRTDTTRGKERRKRSARVEHYKLRAHCTAARRRRDQTATGATTQGDGSGSSLSSPSSSF